MASPTTQNSVQRPGSRARCPHSLGVPHSPLQPPSLPPEACRSHLLITTVPPRPSYRPRSLRHCKDPVSPSLRPLPTEQLRAAMETKGRPAPSRVGGSPSHGVASEALLRSVCTHAPGLPSQVTSHLLATHGVPFSQAVSRLRAFAHDNPPFLPPHLQFQRLTATYPW